MLNFFLKSTIKITFHPITPVTNKMTIEKWFNEKLENDCFYFNFVFNYLNVYTENDINKIKTP